MHLTPKLIPVLVAGFLAAAMPLSAAGTDAPPPFVDEFTGKQLDAGRWETSGNPGLTLFTVKDGSLRVICEGMTQVAAAATRRGDFDFFRTPLTVVWDLDPERTLAGPYASTPNGKIYAGLAIGGTKPGAPAAELGLTAWPEGFPKPAPDAPWYYTLNLGRLMPQTPTADARILGVPTRITWTLDATTSTVTIDGATFASGDPRRRAAAHGLTPANFPDQTFRLRIVASPHGKSMEPGVNHIPAVVYCEGIRVLAPDAAAKFQTASPAPKPAAAARKTPKTVTTTPSPALRVQPQQLFGVNYAGGTFRHNDSFICPTPESLDYYRDKGVVLMRLPFDWEPLQPQLGQPLSEKYLAALKQSVRLMSDRNLKVLLDLHNYARYNKDLIGTGKVPMDAFKDVWKRLAEAFKDDPAIWGYGLMNEPYKTNGAWPKMAQAGIDGVRSVDSKTMIVVSGDNFAGTHSWKKNGADLPKQLHDPADNLCYEGHCYFDADGSGKYVHSYEFELNRPRSELDPMLGVRRLEPFVAWLKENHLKGLVGEFSVPANPDRDERWLEILDNACDYLGRNGIQSTFWSGGTLWTPGRCCVLEPRQGQDRPQMQILLKYAGKYAAPAPGK